MKANIPLMGANDWKTAIINGPTGCITRSSAMIARHLSIKHVLF